MTVTLQPVDLTVNDKLKAALRAALSDQRGNCLAEAVPMLPKCTQQASVESFKTRIDVVLDAMHRLHRSNITAGFSLMRAAYEKAIEMISCRAWRPPPKATWTTLPHRRSSRMLRSRWSS